MMSSIYKTTWTGPKAALEVGAYFLSDVLDPPAEAVGLSKSKTDNNTQGSSDSNDDAAWTLEAFFEDEPDVASITAAIVDFDATFASAEAENVEHLEDRDWVAHSLEGLGVVEAGQFVLYGIHDADKVKDMDDCIPIRIDANQAFGTGHHPTTAGCLTLLSRFAGAPPGSILDLGCGSGVLAIAAAKLWNTEVLAVDIDETSIEIARENARLNGVDDKVTFEVADGFDHKEVRDAAPFDFTFANILAGPLVDLAPAMAENANAFGRVMLAGLLKDQEDAVNTAYCNAGFKRINRLDQGTWPILFYVRP